MLGYNNNNGIFPTNNIDPLGINHSLIILSNEIHNIDFPSEKFITKRKIKI